MKEENSLLLNSYFLLADGHRSTANPKCNQLMPFGYAVKTLKRESAPKLKENDGNAQFSFCLIADTD
jgi:hypothetical protein